MSQGYTKGIPIDTDPQLSLDSDLVVPSQAAVKSYVASYQGSANNSAALGGIPAASYALKIDVAPAFDKANTANITADLAFNAANTAQNTAVGAWSTANAAGIIAIAAVEAVNVAQNTAVAAFDVANTASVDAVAAFGAANTANVTSVASFGAANTAQYTANLAFDTANAAFSAANNAVTDFSPAFIAANTAQYTANLAFDTANGAYGQANTATTNAGTAQGTAVAAFGVANTANSTSVAAYGQANTATTNAGTAQSTAVAAFGQANTAQSTGVSAFGVANTANATSVAAFGAANTAQSTAVAAFTEANTAESIAIAAFGQANTAQSTSVAAFGVANTAQTTAVAAFGAANTAQSTAIAAFGVANAALPAIGGTINGDLVVTGNVTFSGETTYANTQHLNIGDALFVLNADLPFDQPPTEDSGLTVNRGNLNNADLFWDEAADKWTMDDGTAIHRRLASNTDVEVVSAAAIGAFAKANNAQLDAISAFGAANTAQSTAVAAFGVANTANSTSVSAFGAANTAQSAAVAAFGVANSAVLAAAPAFDKANTAETIAISAFGAANTAQSTAVEAFAKANTALANTSGISFAGDLYFPTGNVGIGTNSSVAKLTINFDNILEPTSGGGRILQLENANTSTNSKTSITFYGNDAGGTLRHGASILWGKSGPWTAGGNDYASYLSFYTRTTGSTQLERMRIDANGNVGIGTTSPSDKLQVASTDGDVDFSGRVDSATASHRPSFRFMHTGGSLTTQSPDNARLGLVSFLGVNDGGALTTYSFFDSFLDGAANGSANSYLRFYTTSLGSSSERMRIGSDGNISIGGHATISSMNVVPTIQAAFDKANTALANTSGISFNGDLNFPTGNIVLGSFSGNIARITANANPNDAVALRIQGAGTGNNTQMRFYGKGAQRDLFAIGTDIEAGDGSAAFDIYDMGSNANRFRIAANGLVSIPSSVSINGTFICNTGDIFISRVSTAYGYVVRPNVAGYKKLQFAVMGGGALEDLYVNATNTQIQGSLGIGTAASGTSGEIRATNNITAYYSDKRLKSNVQIIDNALNKVNQISGVTFQSNEEAAKYGYTDQKMQVGVLAQEIEAVLPEIVVPAPFDIGKNEDGSEYSLSGQNYKTVQYEKLVPLLIEAIKEMSSKIDILQNRIEELEKK